MIYDFTIATDGNPLRQCVTDTKKSIGHAKQARAHLDKYARQLCEVLRLSFEDYQRGPLKTPERIEEKAAEKYDGDVSRVLDICRAEVFFDDPNTIRKLRALFGAGRTSSPFNTLWKEGHDIELVEYRDYFAVPSDDGFRGGFTFKVIINLGKGRHHIAELQLVHRGMQEANNQSHEIYEHIRSIRKQAMEEGRPLTENELWQIEMLKWRNADIYDAAAERLGLDELLSNDGREKVFQRNMTQREQEIGYPELAMAS